MGVQKVFIPSGNNDMNQFIRQLLHDVKALEYMLDNNWFEDDVVRIGAEQEMFLINKKTYKPVTIAMEVMEQMKDYSWVETELAKFNLEVNSTPRLFIGHCFREMEQETLGWLATIKEHLKPFGAEILLTGILPTLRKFDLELHNLTPKPRYRALMDAINSQQLGNAYELRMIGIDELLVKHDSPLIEACNTSFQVHLQVRPQDFVKYYNIAQSLTAPLMAIAANSPIVFGKRLWHESRIALFQQALDTRSTHNHMRERSPRVSFGSGWLENSIMEIYREDIARFRVLLGGEVQENSWEAVKNGKVPKLKALQIHNGTVYRWNRPCYGISENGKPHLRIENRVLPAGPTVIDEMANAALWLGAIIGLSMEVEDIRQHMSWEDARDNLTKAAKMGIDSTFTWFNDTKVGACELILKEILPLARKGLSYQNIAPEDIDRYCGVIEERAKYHMNGARWQLRAYSKLAKEVGRDEALSALTASIHKNQAQEIPVHRWLMPTVEDLDEYSPEKLMVDEFMETDLYTVQKDDIIELVATLMDWRNIRFMPVEDAKGNLSGLVTSQNLMKHYINDEPFEKSTITMVKEIMIPINEVITISANATIKEAAKLMRENDIGCLVVVNGTELVGMITETEFLRVSRRLIERNQK